MSPQQKHAIVRRIALCRTFPLGQPVRHVVTGKEFEVLYTLEAEQLVIVCLPHGAKDFTHTFHASDLAPLPALSPSPQERG
jgi:hypothetical protein